MNHVLSGAVIGVLSRNIPEAAIAGFVSHFVLDSIPHWGATDVAEYERVAIRDGLVGLSFAAIAIATSATADRPTVAAGILGACLPDSDKPNRKFFGRTGHPEWFTHIHQSVQKEHPSRMTQEWAVAAGLAGLFVGASLWRRQKRRYATATASIANLPTPSSPEEARNTTFVTVVE